MIKLPGGYAITADERQYVLNKLYVAGPNAKNRAPGEEYAVPLTYYSTLAGVLQALIKRLQREAVANGDVSTLEEAAALFRRIQAETSALVFPGEEGANQ